MATSNCWQFIKRQLWHNIIWKVPVVEGLILSYWDAKSNISKCGLKVDCETSFILESSIFYSLSCLERFDVKMVFSCKNWFIWLIDFFKINLFILYCLAILCQDSQTFKRLFLKINFSKICQDMINDIDPIVQFQNKICTKLGWTNVMWSVKTCHMSQKVKLQNKGD